MNSDVDIDIIKEIKMDIRVSETIFSRSIPYVFTVSPPNSPRESVTLRIEIGSFL